MNPDEVKGILELGFAGGAFGLVVWVVQRTFKTTIPRLAKEFREALDKQQEAYRADLRETREAFRAELRDERLSMQKLLESEREGRERIAARIDTLILMVERMEERWRND